MKTIAISGKGGTGKSTIAALVVRWLSENRSGSILAVDADSNVNLNDILGVKIKDSVGAIREEMKKSVNNLPAGMTKQQFLEYKIQTSLVETHSFDLIAMGRPEGPGCYCYANNLLRDILKTLGENYAYVVIDNEAGMEHLSRRTTQAIDYLLSVSDASPRGIQTTARISKLLEELDTRVRARFLIVNRAPEKLTETVRSAIEQEKLNLLGVIPEDTSLLQMDRDGTPVYNLSVKFSAYKAIDQIMHKLEL
ncbi:MAG: AAA family ATPase [Candidatus Aminicenantes bacterium]|jgi:CO dehydrogenase maturation factor